MINKYLDRRIKKITKKAKENFDKDVNNVSTDSMDDFLNEMEMMDIPPLDPTIGNVEKKEEAKEELPIHLIKIRNQLISLHELADFYFCYAWLFEKNASIVHIYGKTLVMTAMCLSALAGTNFFNQLNCSNDSVAQYISNAVMFLVAIMIGFNERLDFSSVFKDHREWASKCINNYYEIKHWMIDANEDKEPYISFSARLTAEYVAMTKKSKPLDWLTKKLFISHFKDTKLQFPPILQSQKSKSVNVLDLRPIIDNLINENIHNDGGRLERGIGTLNNYSHNYDSSSVRNSPRDNIRDSPRDNIRVITPRYNTRTGSPIGSPRNGNNKSLHNTPRDKIQLDNEPNLDKLEELSAPKDFIHIEHMGINDDNIEQTKPKKDKNKKMKEKMKEQIMNELRNDIRNEVKKELCEESPRYNRSYMRESLSNSPSLNTVRPNLPPTPKSTSLSFQPSSNSQSNSPLAYPSTYSYPPASYQQSSFSSQTPRNFSYSDLIPENDPRVNFELARLGNL